MFSDNRGRHNYECLVYIYIYISYFCVLGDNGDQNKGLSVTTFVTPSLWNLFGTFCLWVMEENGKV